MADDANASTHTAKAALFVAGAELPAAPKHMMLAGQPIDFDAFKAQTMVAGGDIISFAKGVSAQGREDLLNCSLFAQLVANKAVPDPAKIRDWYAAFFKSMSEMGWLVQGKGFQQYKESGVNLEVHKAILKVAAVIFGPGATAVAIIKSTLDALGETADGDWITLFKRETQRAKAARFQMTLAEPGAADQFLVSMLTFELKAKADLTQVLFFKFKSSAAKLWYSDAKLTPNAMVLDAIRAKVKERLIAYFDNYVATVEI